MPRQKIKSSHYLTFIGSKRSLVPGNSGNVDVHHEGVFKGFKGASKSHNDFQAVPLDHELHLYGRHQNGIGWWETTGVNYKEAIKKLLTEYKQYARESEFDSPEDYENQIELVDWHLEMIDEIIQSDLK